MTHANFVNQATESIDQGAIDTDLRRVYGGADPGLKIQKTNYTNSARKSDKIKDPVDYWATVVGFRSPTAGWRFFYQNHKVDVLTKKLILRNRVVRIGG